MVNQLIEYIFVFYVLQLYVLPPYYGWMELITHFPEDWKTHWDIQIKLALMVLNFMSLILFLLVLKYFFQDYIKSESIILQIDGSGLIPTHGILQLP